MRSPMLLIVSMLILGNSACTKEDPASDTPPLTAEPLVPQVEKIQLEVFEKLELQEKLEFDTWDIDSASYKLSMNSKKGEVVRAAEGVLPPWLIDSIDFQADSIILFGHTELEPTKRLASMLSEPLTWQNDSCTIFINKTSIDTLYLQAVSDTILRIKGSSPNYYGSKYPIMGKYHYRYSYKASLNKRNIIK